LKPHWKGHDQKGNLIFGKTWVHEFKKGGKFAYRVVKKNPKVVIKLKQPLSYAKDIIESQQKRKTKKPKIRGSNYGEKNSKQFPIPSSIKKKGTPSKEWMYKERQKLSAGLRYFILKRDDFKCQLCGASGIDPGVRLEVDHIIALENWGMTEIDNLRTLCRKCNKGKGTKVE
jgi:5-methylcytosine-specific restriction endonuclease McrA